MKVKVAGLGCLRDFEASGKNRWFLKNFCCVRAQDLCES